MAANFAVTFRHLWCAKKFFVGYKQIFALLLVFASLSKGIRGQEDTPLPSSHSGRESQNEISIQISESLKNTRTLNGDSPGDTNFSSDRNDKDAIVTTAMLTDSSYTIRDPRTERLIETRSKRYLDDDNVIEKESNEVEETRANKLNPSETFDDFYEGIKPTKTVNTKEEKISATEIEDNLSGEAEGVSMKKSRPRNKNYNRDGRNAIMLSKKLYESYEEKRKQFDIKKINFERRRDDLPVNVRESREEENRKANPDIQDIITGIVKILNGNGAGQTDASGRPLKPSNTRINNRGPPKISDVPPLEFEGPPSFVPLPPPPSDSKTRIPPPYPFDVPPPLPNVPLPPQPKPPGQNPDLPSHPFIDGVPIPEAIVPGKVSESMEGNKKPFNVSGPIKNENIKFSSMNNNPPQNVNLTRTNVTYNYPKQEPNKNKMGPQKMSPNKRPRPRPGQRPRPVNGTVLTMKPKPNKNSTSIVPVTKLEINATTVRNEPETENVTDSPTTTTEKATDKISTLIKEVLSEVLNGTTKPNATETKIKNDTEKLEINVELPVLLEPTLGVGEATPVLESSIPEISSSSTIDQSKTTTVALSSSQISTTTENNKYKVRPGIVLDDPEYKPGGHKRPAVTNRPIITAPPQNHYGEIFDVTVHAVQGPGGESSGKPYVFPVEIDGVKVHAHEGLNGEVPVITKPQEGQNFVSIDGKRTYINLFGESSTAKVAPTSTRSPITGTGFAVPHKDSPVQRPAESRPVSLPPPRRPYKKPTQPPVRIDTCIVGDDTTCDSAQNEMCRTEDGVSSCHCRPGYNRRKHRDPCRRVVSMVTSLRVDRLYDRKVRWQDTLKDPDSEEYQQLSYEAGQAIESAMSMTPFSDDFINSHINSIYAAKNLETNEPAVYINMTIQLEENLDTVRPAVKHDIQRHLIRVIQRRNNNVGNSAVWVDSPPGSILALQDVDECSSAELHDCHERATCSNTFGSFKCQCQNGFRDPWTGNIHRQGRFCETCPPDYCNNRGECKFEHGQQTCHCSGSFYGAQCEIDGEVLGVAIGASVAAAIIIILTLVCLCMWSRRWSREQKSAVGGIGSPVFGYMATGPTVKTPSIGGPPYQVSLEDRIRWAQIADVMAQANHYAPEPGTGTTRTSFGGYPTLPSHTLSMAGTLPLPALSPPVPLPRLNLQNKGAMSTYGGHSQHGSMHQSLHGLRNSLDTTSSSEEEDRADLLGRHFNAPRPKSRASVANQSCIYYDVDFERSDIYGKQNIPMNTYTMNPQHQARPYFR